MGGDFTGRDGPLHARHVASTRTRVSCAPPTINLTANRGNVRLSRLRLLVSRDAPSRPPIDIQNMLEIRGRDDDRLAKPRFALNAVTGDNAVSRPRAEAQFW